MMYRIFSISVFSRLRFARSDPYYVVIAKNVDSKAFFEVEKLKEGLPAVHNFDAYFYLDLHSSAIELSEKSLCDDS